MLLTSDADITSIDKKIAQEVEEFADIKSDALKPEFDEFGYDDVFNRISNLAMFHNSYLNDVEVDYIETPFS